MFEISFWQAFFIAMLLTHITIITVTVFLHRSQTHRALDLHPALNHFFRFWQWLTTGMVTKEWVAVHRKHHAHVETENDPHSPQIYGINRILWLGVFQYVKACATPGICEEYGRGTPDDWLERNVYSRFKILGVSLMLVTDFLLFGWFGLGIWAVQMLWIPFLAAGVINGVGHYFGYRNYHSPDASRNIVPWGILIGGEELHNNHHAYPTSAKLSSKWYEFDIGYFYIRLFEILCLAKVLRKMPDLMQIKSINGIEDRVAYIKKSRLLLLAKYRETVCAPVLTSYLPVMRLPEKCSVEMLRSVMFGLSEDAKQSVRAAINDHEVLRQVKEFSDLLDALLKEKCQSAQATLNKLKQLCEDARESNNKLLADYCEWLEMNLLPEGASA